MASIIDWNALEQTAAPNLAGKSISDLITIILPLVFWLAGILLLFYLLYAGYQWMTSENDPKALAVARTNLTYAIIGFLVIFISYWAAKLLGAAFGLTGKGGFF